MSLPRSTIRAANGPGVLTVVEEAVSLVSRSIVAWPEPGEAGRGHEAVACAEHSRATRASPRFRVLVAMRRHAISLRALPCIVAGMIRIGSIVLRVDDLPRQTEFWEAALDYVRRQGDSEDFVLLRPRNGVGPNLSLDRVCSTMQVPPRIHLDLYTGDQAGEVERLIGLGATEVHWDKRPPDADYVILADPEGNRFCVVDIN